MLSLPTLTACDSIGQQAQFASALVRVNGNAISAEQLDGEILRLGVAADGSEKGKILDTLIDQQLLKAEAVRNHLDRDPQVKLAVENAKARIFAQAYLQAKMAQAGQAARTEVEEYYRSHPALFAERKIYDMRQLLIATKHFSNELKKAMDAAKSLDDIAAWLDGRNIPYVQARIARSSAELPAALESKLREGKGGRLLAADDGMNTILVSVEAAEEIPMGLAAAAPDIERLLLRRRRDELAGAELKRLRSAAKLEYHSLALAQGSSGHAGDYSRASGLEAGYASNGVK